MGGKYPSDWDTRRKKVYRRDNHRCNKCGARGGPRGSVELHAHHKTPISEGGSHRFRNLTTVCKSCHENIHGHGVGGRSSSTTDSEDEIDPVAGAISVGLVVLVVFLGVTYGAVIQVLPAGQTVSEEYHIEYHSDTEDPDGYGQEIRYDVGQPLILKYELADNVISEKDSTRLRVSVHNPSGNHLRGQVDVLGHTNYWLKGEVATFDFDLAPGETASTSVSLSGSEMVADSGVGQRKTTFGAEAHIFTNPYRVTSTQESDILAEKMNLKVRKPLLSRLGLYWLIVLSLCFTVGGYLFRKNRDN